MHYVPTEARLLVTIVTEKVSDTIILPETSKDPPSRGKVLAVGPKVDQVKVGDKIIFGRYSGTDIVLEREAFRVMNQNEVLLIEKA